MGLDDAVRNFIYLVVDHRRTEMLPEMEEAFLSELNERLGIVDAEVTSAHELNDDEKTAIATVLEQRTGKKVEARFQKTRRPAGRRGRAVGLDDLRRFGAGSAETVARTARNGIGAVMANIKADEITKILKEQIENYQQTVEVDEIGSVISVGDGIARVHGLEKCMAGEMLAFPHDVTGIALNLEEDQVGVVLLGDYTEIKEGDIVKRTNKIMSVPVGDALIGRVVDPLGNPLDDKGPIQTNERLPLERLAPGVVDGSLCASRFRRELNQSTR